VHIKYIQAMLDHSSILITMDTYAHLMNPTDAEAADRLARLTFSDTLTSLKR
jgi:integrase